MDRETQDPEFDFGPDPRIDPPPLPAGDPLAFLNTHLLPLLSDDSGEKVFVRKGAAILRDLWRSTHAHRPSEDRERRGRGSVKLSAFRALSSGLDNKEYGRSGKPTQGDLERILEKKVPDLDEDTRRKYAKLYRLTYLESRYDSLTEQDWAWLAKRDRDFVHRAFFTLKFIRDSAIERGVLDSPNERAAILCYVALCNALQRLGKPFSAPSFVEIIDFSPGPDK